MKHIALVFCALSNLVTVPVFAAEPVWGTGNDDEWIFVGMVDAVADEVEGKVAAVCYDSTTNNVHDKLVILGDEDGLTDDYIVHGDSIASGTGNDLLMIISGSGVTPGDENHKACQDGNGLVNGTWDALVYNGHYLDLYGDGGDEEELEDGGGSNDTWLRGGDGDDYLEQFSSIGSANGEDDNDTVYGLTGGSTDVIQGGEGKDCLWDSNNGGSGTFTTFDCGAGSDDVYDSRNSDTSNCENSLTCCGLC